MKDYFLTDEEMNVLDRISQESGNDAWFWIYRKRNGATGFHDLENNAYRSLRVGVAEMDEALTEYDDYNLTKEEITVYENIKKKLNI